MIKEHKIYFFKNRSDYEKKLTDDKVINVIGLKGSGKTTFTSKYNDGNYIVISTDELLEIGDLAASKNPDLNNVKELLKNKYSKIEDNQKFINYYEDIIEYANNQNKTLILEGNAIENINPVTNLKGKVIVKRTAILKCFQRAVKRDYNNEFFMKKEVAKYGKLGRLVRFIKVLKRRIKIFKQHQQIENKIKELELINTQTK